MSLTNLKFKLKTNLDIVITQKKFKFWLLNSQTILFHRLLHSLETQLELIGSNLSLKAFLLLATEFTFYKAIVLLTPWNLTIAMGQRLRLEILTPAKSKFQY
jgi:hypothetical protein